MFQLGPLLWSAYLSCLRAQLVAFVQVLVRLERENRKGEEARRRAVEEAEENRQIANRAMVLSSC